MDVMSFEMAEKALCRLLNALCCPVSVDTLFCSVAMGSEAIDTARLRTCWKSAENELCPVKTGTDEVAILVCYAKKGPNLNGPAPVVKGRNGFTATA